MAFRMLGPSKEAWNCSSWEAAIQKMLKEYYNIDEVGKVAEDILCHTDDRIMKRATGRWLTVHSSVIN